MQAFTVPQGVTVLHVQAWGASGGTAPNNGICTIGGLGGYAFGDLAVSSGVTVWVSVGGEGVPGGTGGWNRGGDACNNTLTCASGGGASDIRFGGQTLNDRVLVGAGGGGAEYSGCAGTGGNGGGLIGDAGSESYPHNGTGGTQSEGGSPTGGTHLGTSGMFGISGTSGNHPEGHSAGGGGGWWGGAGSAEDGHGGGGSSYYGGMSGSRGTTAGVQSGKGRIVITW